MESHVRYFIAIGGVYNQMVYDYMLVAVSKFVRLHVKEPPVSLLELRGHYGFTHCFCNVYRGNEKGHIEQILKYVPCKAFVLIDRFNTVCEAEKRLLSLIHRFNATKQTAVTNREKSYLRKKSHFMLRFLFRGCCVLSRLTQY